MPLRLSILSFYRNNRRLIFFGSWFLLNLFQARMTGLFEDEAYYWVYSKFPAWGYFDHPPMIALFIRAGFFLFKNELGVRLMVVIAGTLVLMVLEAMLPRKNDSLFYAIVCSMAALQLGGFMSLPDIPMMLFTAIYFLIYRQFLKQANYGNTILMGLIIALMLYSKYQTVLIILFTFASNPRLLLKPQTYLFICIAVLFFLPHILWQIQHGFISVQYQLVERHTGSPYRLNYTLEYLSGQLLFAGPLAGPLLLWAGFAYRPKDLFEKSLKYTLIGIYGFFLVMTQQGRVEANWTAPAFVPLIILSYLYLQSKASASRWIFRLAPVTLICVLVLRVYLALNVQPLGWLAKDEVHGNRQWSRIIQKKAKGLPVFFIDSYQKASVYWFYTGQPSFSLNTPEYHRNNYNIWPVEDSFQNKAAYGVGAYDSLVFNDSIVTPKGLMGGKVIPHYLSFSKMTIDSKKRLNIVNHLGADIKLAVAGNRIVRQNSLEPLSDVVQLQLWIDRRNQPSKIINTGIPLNRLISGERNFVTSFSVDLPRGIYEARFAIPSSVPANPTLNSTYLTLNLTNK
jgi:Dolichyl-phosphate-mannose-protein mannosyltransferase